MQPSRAAPKEAARPIYLDNAATTCTDGRVASLIHEMLCEEYGNPSSLHNMGLRAERRVAAARRQVASLAGCREEEVCFTSGATEANNLALIGAARAKARRGRRIVTSQIEHASVLSALDSLAADGFDIVKIPPRSDGTVDPEAFAEAVDEGTVLASCMLVNNETGALCDVADIASRCKAKNPQLLFHCDGVQALGKVPFSFKKLPVDLMSFSGHKLFAPKGIGALVVKKGVRLLPLLYGGNQQGGLRPGTENTAYIAGMGLACELARQEFSARLAQMERLHDHLLKKIAETPQLCSNSPLKCAPNIVNLSVPGIRSETMLHFLEGRGIYVSSASACTKGAKSHVLAAMGLPDRLVDSALRLSFSPDITEEDLDLTIAALCEGASSLARA